MIACGLDHVTKSDQLETIGKGSNVSLLPIFVSILLNLSCVKGERDIVMWMTLVIVG